MLCAPGLAAGFTSGQPNGFAAKGFVAKDDMMAVATVRVSHSWAVPVMSAASLCRAAVVSVCGTWGCAHRPTDCPGACPLPAGAAREHRLPDGRDGVFGQGAGASDPILGCGG